VTFTLDAHAAKSCPVKIYSAFSGLPARHVEPPPRFPGSAEFNRKVVQALIAAGCVVAPDDANDSGEAACLAAMEAGAKLIRSGLLPRDLSAHRAGRVPILVRDEADRGYYPAMVRYQRVTEQAASGLCEYSALSDPTIHHQLAGRRFRWSWRSGTALQLTHYWLLLQACGYASDRALGGVIGIDEFADDAPAITWVDLDEPCFSVNDAVLSPFQVYALEFGKRVEIAERAQANDPRLADELLPIISHECAACGWHSHCVERLDPDDLSLRIEKAPLDPEQIAVLREAGIFTTKQLAELDLDGFLPGQLPLMGQRAGAEYRLKTAQHRSQLIQAGVEFERTTTGKLTVPAAELEIDIDLETNHQDRVYLWGFWVDDRARGRLSYHRFARFEPLDDAAELALANEAMGWLRNLVRDADALVYHYSDYETVRINRLANASDDPELSWARDYSQSNFIDLFAVMRANYFSTHGLGLKAVARDAAGFHWRDTDPGGLNSMRWFEDATTSETAELREQARTRILEYNEDDVRATWTLRRWLRDQ
jgi:predicted RecB family nuclease